MFSVSSLPEVLWGTLHHLLLFVQKPAMIYIHCADLHEEKALGLDRSNIEVVCGKGFIVPYSTPGSPWYRAPCLSLNKYFLESASYPIRRNPSGRRHGSFLVIRCHKLETPGAEMCLLLRAASNEMPSYLWR